MRSQALLAATLVLVGATALWATQAVSTQEETAVATASTSSDVAAQQETLRRYCVRCHNDRMLRGGFSLAEYAVANPHADTDLSERIVRKLVTGLMPPPGAPRPEGDALTDLRMTLEAQIDERAAQQPNPGRRTFQRLNRAEYQRTVGDLLDIEVDAGAFLPPDTVSKGFDSIADVQAMSATLMQGYLRAADQVSRQAVGSLHRSPGSSTFKVPRTASQVRRVEGAPRGTRGGLSVRHHFPADGEYHFAALLHGTPTGQFFGSASADEKLEISVDGGRVALIDLDPLMDESDPEGLTVRIPGIHIKSGPRQITAAFLEKFTGPVDDLIAPIEHTLADTQIGGSGGITALPHLRELTITGPYGASGTSSSPSRRRVFSCRPTQESEELECAESILRRLARSAYRRDLNETDLEGLLGFYREGRDEGGFEEGIRMALQAILASPHFVFRIEQPPTHRVAEAGDEEIYRLASQDVATRLAYFLWASGPDDELLRAAAAGELESVEGITAQANRMLRMDGAAALATRFASQWLRLQDLDAIHPDALAYPQFDQTLAAAMRRESELFFADLVARDASVLELLDSQSTFVNERLAGHYGLPDVSGDQFQKVSLEGTPRRGLLGQGSILTLTSHANRTSPVLRGKWVMEVLLGSPPPPPPPDVPELEATEGTADGRRLTVRERLEIHRDNPSCNSCHRVIDPIGLALENYDVTGAWRIRDEGALLDTQGRLFDGSDADQPSDLTAALVRHSEAFARTFTENLMAYALGRRVETSDMPEIRRIVRRAASDDYRFSSFVQGIVESPGFSMSVADSDSEAVERASAP